MTLREFILSLSQHYRVNIRSAINAGELGLNGMHVRCLVVIANTPNCTANCIVKKTKRDKAQIARLVKEMIIKGWLEKNASATDKRSHILSLSESGIQLQKRIKHLEQSIEDSLMSNLSANDIADFEMIMGKLLANTSIVHNLD